MASTSNVRNQKSGAQLPLKQKPSRAINIIRKKTKTQTSHQPTTPQTEEVDSDPKFKMPPKMFCSPPAPKKPLIVSSKSVMVDYPNSSFNSTSAGTLTLPMIQQKYQQISAEHLRRSTSSPWPPQQLKVMPNPNATCTITSGTRKSTVTFAIPKTLVTSVAQQKTANAIELYQPEYTFEYIIPMDPELNALLLQNQDNNLFGNNQLLDPNILETREILYSSTEPEFTSFVSDNNLHVNQSMNEDDKTVLINNVDNRQEILQKVEKDGKENLIKDLDRFSKRILIIRSEKRMSKQITKSMTRISKMMVKRRKRLLMSNSKINQEKYPRKSFLCLNLITRQLKMEKRRKMLHIVMVAVNCSKTIDSNCKN